MCATHVVHGASVRCGQVAVAARIRDASVVVELDAQGLEVVDPLGPVDVALDERRRLARRPQDQRTHDGAIPCPHAGEVVHGQRFPSRVVGGEGTGASRR